MDLKKGEASVLLSRSRCICGAPALSLMLLFQGHPKMMITPKKPSASKTPM